MTHPSALRWIQISACAATLLGGAQAATTTYSAAGGTATFEHKVRFINVKGNIADVTSTVQLDAADLAATKGTVTVPVVKLKTGLGLRDDHARSEVALNAAKFPNAVFTLDKLTGGKLLEGQTLSTTASGKLTIKGKTLPVTAPVKATLQGGKVNVSTQFKINPHDYGVDYPGSSDSATLNVTFTLAPR
ncbi:YceI family protein [Deinococcus sp. Arct2-2]|uniref:YceI family protein n=1 Tax=Deinococcus sp. Arct2-2 TaxID=2568653 RepID=UPI0010A366D0|nr:YceI family protein [Deinococcus sp. Arct2-2]THF70026.1 YceI family protein [Deinococcus sp. Arct2-2]